MLLVISQNNRPRVILSYHVPCTSYVIKGSWVYCYIGMPSSFMMCHMPIMPISSCSTMWQWNMAIPS